jgi:uncharacterized protein (DUF433 family)
MSGKSSRQLIGMGIYTFPEASRLAGVPIRSIRRWALGYEYVFRGERYSMPPVLKPQLDPIGEATALSFLDLQEIRFLHAFRSHGVSWQTLRVATEKAKAIVGSDHPFSTGQFRDDGKRIMTRVADESGDPALHDIISNQLIFSRIIKPYLRGLEFSGRYVARWFPAPDRRVVVDPTRSFGQPVVDKGGVPTLVLAKAFKAEKSIAKVAQWYELDPSSVRAAVAFEHQLAA